MDDRSDAQTNELRVNNDQADEVAMVGPAPAPVVATPGLHAGLSVRGGTGVDAGHAILAQAHQGPPAVAAPTIHVHTVTGPGVDQTGTFEWLVRFTTTGRNGWIVQEIRNEFLDNRGHSEDKTEWGLPPVYYEAWYVDPQGVVGGRADSHDQYTQERLPTGHKVTIRGRLFWVPGQQPPQGMAPGNVGGARGLHSSFVAPPNLGLPLYARRVQIWMIDDQRVLFSTQL